MQPEGLEQNVTVYGPLFPDPVQIILAVPMGTSVKLIGKGVRSHSVYEPILCAHQLGQLRASPAQEPFDGDASKFRLGVEATLIAQKVTTAMIAQLLSEKVERPVIDRTGIAGEFDITLEWTPTGSPEAGMSIFSALQEQLGLKFEAARTAVDLLVIGQIQRPSAN